MKTVHSLVEVRNYNIKEVLLFMRSQSSNLEAYFKFAQKVRSTCSS